MNLQRYTCSTARAFAFLFLGVTLLCPAAVHAAEPGHISQADLDKRDRLPWPERRQAIEEAWLSILGDFPADVPDLKPQMKEVAYEDGVTRYHVSFQSEVDDRVTAWLLVPDGVKQQEKPAPAIICLHSTTWGSGKDSVVGISGRRPVDPPRPEVGADYGLTLAKHGFVTLSIDMLGDGERIAPEHRMMDSRDFYQKHPEWSMVGKTIWDVMRSCDFLQTLDFVDGEQIGCTGWSLGGHMALFAAAFEPRIKATISNGGVLDWHRKVAHWSRLPRDNNWRPWTKGVDEPTSSKRLEERFGFKTNSGPLIYIKSFRPYIDDQSLVIPADFDELMMLVAPRALMVISTEYEFVQHKFFAKAPAVLEVYTNWKDIEGQPSAFGMRQQRIGHEATLEYYETQHRVKPERIPGILTKLGAADAFGWYSFPGGHSYPGNARRATFAWFDRWLGRTLD